MASEVTDQTIKCFVTGIRLRLDKAAAVARAAEACSRAGGIEQAISILLDVEQPIYEATSYLNAASLLKKCTKL